MKKFLRIAAWAVGGLVAFIAVIAAIAFYATSGIVETADRFLAASRTDNVPGARIHLSDAFNRSLTEPELHALFQRSGLDRMKDVSWHSRGIQNGHGKLQGEMTTTDGAHLPLALRFVKEGGAWKISGIRKTLPDEDQAADTPANAGMPTNAQQVAMVRTAMHDFAVSVNDKSMAHFRDTVSSLWQSQVKVADLDAGFRAAIDSGSDFLVFDRVSPQFDAQPSIDDNGVLVIQGHYPTTPQQLFFVQKYVREGVEWKLLGFRIQTK